MARFVVLVIDSFGVRAMKDVTVGRSARCGSEYLWRNPQPVAAFAGTNAWRSWG
ncbi:hypothetical protein ACLK1S_20930 [Escherichia coli]